MGLLGSLAVADRPLPVSISLPGMLSLQPPPSAAWPPAAVAPGGGSYHLPLVGQCASLPERGGQPEVAANSNPLHNSQGLTSPDHESLFLQGLRLTSQPPP